MHDDWIKSPAARRIFIHWTDTRPAWVWSQDGTELHWRNRAAAFFGAKLKKSGLKLAAEPVPIKGQIARVIRLGSVGRSSLARLQFLAGGRPVSTTATVTPLTSPSGKPIVLAVGVDAIDPDILAQPITIDGDIEFALLPDDAAYLILNADDTVIGGSAGATERFAAPPADAETIVADGRDYAFTRYGASPQGDQLVVISGAMANDTPGGIDDLRTEEGIGALELPDRTPASDEPLLPMGIIPAPPAEVTDEDAPDEPAGPRDNLRLSSLFDRLADTDALYAGLPKATEGTDAPANDVGADEAPETIAPEAPADAPPSDAPTASEGETIDETPAEAPTDDDNDEPEEDAPVETGGVDVIAAVIEFEDDLDADKGPVTYRVTGRGFIPVATEMPGDGPAPLEPTGEADETTATGDDATEAEVSTADTRTLDGESRRNFSEIGRILTSGAPPAPPVDDGAMDPSIEPMPDVPAGPAPEGALVSIGAETFILNRLPLGILVFRDQQVLFANRALTDLVGYPTIDSLRAAGLSAIFPGDDLDGAGPVTQLVRRDGARMPVTARLQTITWQGRPALMLSAASTDPRASAESAVRGFADTLAGLREEGFISLDVSGVLNGVSKRATELLGADAAEGQPLVTLLSEESAKALRVFLEAPARRAETERPMLLADVLNGSRIALFTEGMAGIVRGYFGIVWPTTPPASEDAEAPESPRAEDPAMLARVSRGVRRPLNTIIGFSDLIRSAAFGTIENHRYLEYARDIRTAGQEIAVLVDELDDYARLSAGTYPVRTAELDLAALLDSCIVRVRGQASAARVLVRSAISEELPHIRADRASLGQAILNLLASAIDQTPANGSVILSAQREDNGGVVINVRDSGAASVDPGERFVVFRDGVGKDGEALAPVRSSVGLALTRSLVAVNACSLSVTPAGAVGTIFSLSIPAELVGPAAA